MRTVAEEYNAADVSGVGGWRGEVGNVRRGEEERTARRRDGRTDVILAARGSSSIDR